MDFELHATIIIYERVHIKFDNSYTRFSNEIVLSRVDARQLKITTANRTHKNIMIFGHLRNLLYHI